MMKTGDVRLPLYCIGQTVYFQQINDTNIVTILLPGESASIERAALCRVSYGDFEKRRKTRIFTACGRKCYHLANDYSLAIKEDAELDKKQEIIDAAFDLFCEKGDHLSMSELAVAVGIKTPSLYSHFTGKSQILERMIREEICRYFDELGNLMNGTKSMLCQDVMKSLYAFVMDYFGEYKRLRFWRMIPLISNEPLRATCSRLIAQKDGLYNERMRQCFMKGVENGELKPETTEGALSLYFAMIQGVLDGMLLYPKGAGSSALAEQVLDAYWNGVRADPVGQKG